MGKELELAIQEATKVGLARVRSALRLSLEADGAQVVPLDKESLVRSATSQRPILLVITSCGEGATSILLLSQERSTRLVSEILQTGADRPIAILSFSGQMVLRQLAGALAASHAERVASLDGGELSIGAPDLVFDGGGEVAAARLGAALREGPLSAVKTSLRVHGETALLGHHLYVLAGALPEESAPAQPEIAPETRRLRVLVAEGDDGTCELLRSWLGEAHDVAFTADGEAALLSCLERRPHVAIISTTLARLSGFAVGWTLRNDARFHGIRLVYLVDAAGLADQEDAVWFGALADGRIPKPITRAAVEAELRLATELPPATPPAVHESQRRLVPRIPVTIPARLSHRAGQMPVVIQELSPRGALVAAPQKLEQGSLGRLALETAHGIFDASCEVLYTRSAEEGILLGLGFRAISEEGQRVLVQTLGASSGD